MPGSYAPGSPEDWLTHALSDLNLAGINPPTGVKLETLCYHAQQSVEKALKALLIQHGVEFPRTHNIRTLLDLIPGFLMVDEKVEESAILTDYAVNSRYPGAYESVTDKELQEAVKIAEDVIRWVKTCLNKIP